MAEPLTKKINDLPEMGVVAASNDKLLMLDVSESAVNMTKLVPMNLLSIHTASQLAANTVGSSQIKAGAVTNSKLGADAVNGAKIADDAIGNEHIRDSVALSVIGRSSSTSGNPADIVAGTNGHVLRRSGTTLGFGQVANAGIANGAVTNSKLGADAVDGAKIADDAIGNEHIRDSAALSVIGRSANSSGNPADIAATTDGYVLRRSGTTLGFGQVVTAGIANNAVTEEKLGTIKRTLFLRVTAPDDTLTVGSTTKFFPFPITLNNFIVVDARINLITASSSGTVTVALLNQGGTMTTLSLAAGATGMSASGTISTSYRTAITNNFLGVNATAAGTGAKGLSITLVLQGVPA